MPFIRRALMGATVAGLALGSVTSIASSAEAHVACTVGAKAPYTATVTSKQGAKRVRRVVTRTKVCRRLSARNTHWVRTRAAWSGAGAPVAASVGYAVAVASPGSASASDAMLAIVNAERAGRGLPTLTACPSLIAAAGWIARDNAARGGLSHVGSDGSDLRTRAVRAAGRDGFGLIGENLAVNTQNDMGTIHAALMASPGHRANLLEPQFRVVGIATTTGNMATASGPRAAVYVAEEFAATCV